MFADMKVGELAARSGVSVRTLHHYHELGLLIPEQHSGGGHRMYSASQLERLLRIKSLQQLGFSLTQVRECLDRPEFGALRAIELQLERLRERLREQERLRTRLEQIADHLRRAEEPSADTLLEAISIMTSFEEHYTPEQLETLARRGQALGPGGMAQAQADWSRLLDDFRAAQAAGQAADSPQVRALALRSRALIAAFTGGDAGIERSLGQMYASKPDMPQQFGMEPTLWEFMGAARDALDANAAE